MQQVGLGFRGPDRAPRALTMAVSRTVEHDDAECLSSHIDEAAGLEVLDHAAVAVQKDQRLAFASLDVMEAHAVNFDELAGWRILALGFLRELTVHHGGYGKRPDRDGRSDGIRVRSKPHDVFFSESAWLTILGETCS